MLSELDSPVASTITAADDHAREDLKNKIETLSVKLVSDLIGTM